MHSNRDIEEENLNLKSVIKKVESWFLYLLAQWKRIGLITLTIGLVFFAYQSLKKPAYTAETTFVLETDSGSGLGGQLSSLANLAGVNLGSLTESSGVFQIDNIIELYRSYRMIKQTLLSEESITPRRERIITYYARENELMDEWQELGVTFEIPESQMTVKHDSLLKEVVEDILEKHLFVSKPSRKLTILHVAYNSDDQLYAKAFNEQLVENVNSFYLETRTKRTGDNLRILSNQTDSVKRVLDQSLQAMAKFEEENPNLNPLRAQALVPLQKIQIDLRASSVVYQEMVKNLELAKIAHRNSQPLIQIIDQPVLPLKDNRMKWYKSLVIGFIIGGILVVFFLTMQYFYYQAMNEST